MVKCEHVTVGIWPFLSSHHKTTIYEAAETVKENEI